MNESPHTQTKMGADLLEVRYATSLEDGTFLDSSGMAKPGTAGDSSLYFVLGEQVAGTGAWVVVAVAGLDGWTMMMERWLAMVVPRPTDTPTLCHTPHHAMPCHAMPCRRLTVRWPRSQSPRGGT
jgi:hypothetical protein